MNGPNTDTWVMPLSTLLQVERLPFRTTHWTLLFRQDFIHSNSLRWISWPLNVLSNLWCGTLSKAFVKSKKITSTLSPLSTKLVTFSKKDSKLFKHIFTCCESTIAWFNSRRWPKHLVLVIQTAYKSDWYKDEVCSFPHLFCYHFYIMD